MDEIYTELVEIKSAMEMLTDKYRIRTELSESLQKAHNEQLIKTKEAKLEIEKQAQELNAKSEEIFMARQMYKNLESNLQEKESVLTCLTFENEKFQADCNAKLQKLEGENRELVFILDEANTRAEEQDKKIHAYEEEIECLKGLLSVSQKKCLEAEQRAKASKELRQRDDLLVKLEEENQKIEDCLKWKKEQFKHLEEAHEKLQDQFQASMKEWEVEKSKLVHEICSLQTSFDSQSRSLENLQSRLQMCNQALAHEESRRKLLEVQMSESKTCYENVFAEYQEVKLKMESLGVRRDEEIAVLRNSLGAKESFLVEMEFRRGHLEQENQELRRSLKELQESQINEAGATSLLKKLRNKLRRLEQVHKECSMNLKARKAEWSSEMEKMTEDLIGCRSVLDCRDKQIQYLEMELEGCHSSVKQLMLENEEMSVMLLVLRSGSSEAQLKLSNSNIEMESCNKEAEQRLAHLMEQLEEKNNALIKAHSEIEQERENATSLMRKVESLGRIEQQYSLMQKELKMYNNMLEESSGHQLALREQAFQKERALNEELGKVSDAFNNANSVLVEKTHEVSELKIELERWKAVAEHVKACLDKNQDTCKELEASLIVQAEIEKMLKQEKDKLLHIAGENGKRVDDLQQKVVLLEQELARREKETTILVEETQKDFEEKQERFLRILEEKDKSIDGLQQQIALLEQEFTRKELEDTILGQIEAEQSFEHEKDRLLQVIEEKDQILDDLKQQAMSMEQDYKGLVEKQVEINTLHEAWEKITAARVLAELEIQLRNLVILELEEEMNSLHHILELHKKNLSHSKHKVEKLGAALEAKQLEMEQAMDQLGSKLTKRESLLAHVVGYSDQVSEFSNEDAELMGILDRIVQSFDKENETVINLEWGDNIFDSSRENVKACHSFAGKTFEASVDRRSPLKERNS